MWRIPLADVVMLKVQINRGGGKTPAPEDRDPPVKCQVSNVKCQMSNAQVDPWDMLNNFCFHVYAQKWHM